MSALRRPMPLLDEALSEVESLISDLNPVELATAVNGKEAQEEWLALANKEGFTNPTFEYDKELLTRTMQKEVPLKTVYRRLLNMKNSLFTDEETLVWTLLTGRVEEALKTVNFAEAIYRRDNREARGIVIQKYGRPDQELISAAWDGVGRSEETAEKPELWIGPMQIEKLQKEKLDAKKIRRWLIRALRAYNLNWPVMIDPEARVIDARDKSRHGKVIIVPEDREVSAMKMLELIGHEVECHVLDSENGSELLHGLGGGALRTDCEELYEGHAKIVDANFHLHYEGKLVEPMPWYVLAISWALSGMSFAKVAEKLHPLLIENGAAADEALKKTWRICYRIFRGCTDCTNPFGYAFTKDAGYLSGYLQAKNLYEAGLAHWLEIGVLTPEELVKVARTVTFSADDLATPYRDVVSELAEELLVEIYEKS